MSFRSFLEGITEWLLAEGAEYEPHSDNLSEKWFDEFVECARETIDDVKPKRAKFFLEMTQ